MTKQAKKDKTVTANPKARRAANKALPAQPKGKKADVLALPAAPRSVVGQAWKAKAGKSGVWRADKLDDAVRSAFLKEGSDKVSPQEAARLATDAILAENQLDAGRWPGKNAGMLSMNLRNVLRGLLRNDGVVFVYGKKIS